MLLRVCRRSFSVNVAVIGSGPAGFYTTQKLLKNPNIKVDIYEKLPVPFGLVRYGVAPDHPDVKNVIKSFTNVANSERVNFFGNVSLGQSINLEDLIDAYHAVVLCYGSAKDKSLNIEGELTKNTVSARNFVGWYNGVPEDKELDIDLDCDTACIVGQGNVALDCARILLRPADLARTDITTYAQSKLASSKIKRIYLVGRRGPIQVAFTAKELREIIKLNESGSILEPSSIFKDNDVTLERLKKLQRPRRRIAELLLGLSITTVEDLAKRNGIELVFKFLAKPHRILASKLNDRVDKLEVLKTKFNTVDEFMDEKAHPIVSDQVETIDCGLVLKSIGYEAVMIDKSLPQDHKKGAILNTDGRVHGHNNLYCSGWLATGASGVIAGTLNSSQITSQSILEDIKNEKLPNLSRKKPGSDVISRLLAKKSVQVVHFNDWLRIDELERKLGESLGKTREKFVDINKMLEVAKSKSSNLD